MQLLKRTSMPVVLLAMLLWMPSQAHAQAADGLTPQHVAEMQIVTSSAISPDARHVAYTVSVPADPFETNAPNTLHLYLLDTSTGETRALHTESSVGGVAFRPEHGTVTFLASITEDAPRGLYEVSVDGGAPSRVLTHTASILAYEWSPDGNRLSFMANEQMEAPATPLPYAPTFYEENLGQRQGFIHNFESGATTQIQQDGSYYIMSWSHTGDRLAVSVAPTSMVDDMYMAQQVFVIDPENASVLNSVDNRGKIGSITWSPDGRQLALRAGDHINDPIDGRIMVVSVAGGTPQNVYRGFQGKFEQIEWTADDTIYFIASESTEKAFGTIRPDGTGMTRTVDLGTANLLSFSRADDGTVAFVANTPSHPSEIYLLRAGETTPERMTTTNEWLADIALGEQRVVTYTARDGEFTIDGPLMLPVDYDGGPVPLIVVVHGGPEAHYSNGWLTAYSMPGQMATARGYAVFYPNYRGSTGRGLEFIMSSQADLAGKEFDDVVDGVDYLIEQGIADADRVGVTGGSYGGYATAWMSTRYSDRFAAGVMFVGISNNLSKWGTSDIPDELYLVHSRERMWESDAKWLDYLHRSPIYHVDNAQTPLLIMHGAEDTRVHPAQSLELYRHLRVRRPDVPVRLILYPGEGHGNVRAASRYDYNLRMMNWFDTFLMGDGEMPSLDIHSELPQVGVQID